MSHEHYETALNSTGENKLKILNAIDAILNYKSPDEFKLLRPENQRIFEQWRVIYKFLTPEIQKLGHLEI